MRLRSLLLPWLALASMHLSGQSVEQWTAWGDAALERNDRYGASRFYAEALNLEPGRMELQWKCAEACRLSNQYAKAAELYEKVHRKDLDRSLMLNADQLGMSAQDVADVVEWMKTY